MKSTVFGKEGTNLGKMVHFYESLDDAIKQYQNDVAKMGELFAAVLYEHFDIKNAYDQTVLSGILTNLLAYVEVYSEMDGVDMQRAMREDFENNLNGYRKLAKENLKKGL